MLCNMFTKCYKRKKHGWHVNLKSTAVTCLYIAQPCTARTFSSQLKPEKMRQSKKGLSTFQPIFQYLSINRMLMMLICGGIHLCTMLPTELGPFWHPRACLMSLGFQGRTWALWCETSFDLTRSRIWLQLRELHGTTRNYIIHRIHGAYDLNSKDGATGRSGRGFQNFFRFLEGTFCSSRLGAPWILPLILFAKFFHVLSVWSKCPILCI
jgi:hypothetical protein